MPNANKRIAKRGVKVIMDTKGGKAPRSDDVAKRFPHKRGSKKGR